MSPVTVILADPQYLVRVGLNCILQNRQDIKILGEAQDEEDLLDLMNAEAADVVILDYQDPDFISKKTIVRLKKEFPQTGILVISADSERHSIYEVLEAGVNSFLTKTCDEKEILEGIMAVAKNQRYFCKKVVDFVFERSFAKCRDDCSPLPLTVRETEIVRLVAKGRIAKEIASELDITPHTVYTHRKNIMRKLKLNSPTELILYAVNKGLVDQ